MNELIHELNKYFYENQYKYTYYRCCDLEWDYDMITGEREYYYIFY